MKDLKMAEKPDEAVEMTVEPNIADTLDVNKEAAGSATSSNDKVEYLDPPVKSDCDNNVYRVLKLSNGLTVLLVSQPSEEKGGESGKLDGVQGNHKNAASRNDTSTETAMFSASGIVECTLTVDVGCLSDSAENPCIAELLSKVVLTASKEYPTPYSFAKFLGMQNCDVHAYCDKERTLFSFTSQEIHLRDALHRFVDCFIEPFLKLEVVEIEKKVDSDAVIIEDAAINHSVDPACTRAKNYLFGIFASKCDNNPASHLIPGRNKVLHLQSAHTLLREIERFMKRHYSAHRMIVTLKAQLSLDKLEEYGKAYFSQIPSNGWPPIDLTRYSFDKCFDSPEFRMIYEFQASCEKLDHRLELHWSMPSRTTVYKSKPTEYLSWVLQQSGKGSLIWYLSKKNWCTDLSCATGNTCLEPNSIFSLFSLSLSVTDEGQKNYKKILDAVYSYINLLRSEGPQRKTYEEIREKLDSQFQRNDQVLRCLCNSHSSLLTMHNHTSADYLNGSIVLSEYDPAAIKQCLDLMSPEKANVIVCQKKYGTRHSLSKTWEEIHDKVEDVKYRRSIIPEAWINRWKNVEPLPEFKLPVVDYATILEDPHKYPVQIRSDDLCEVHLLNTVSFNNRIAVDYLYCTPVPRESAKNSFMLDAFAYLLGKVTSGAFMHLNYVDFNVTVKPHGSGLYELITGPDNPTTLRSIEAIAMYGSEMANYVAKCVTDDVFTEVKADLAAEYLRPFGSSDVLVSAVMTRISSPGQWLFYEKYDALLGANLKKFKHFAQHFFDRIFIKCLAQGNVTRPEVNRNIQRCIRALKCRPLLPKSQIPQNSVYKLLPGTRCCRFQSTSIDDVTTVVNHYQCSERPTVEQSTMISFLGVVIKAPELKSLRARQNLDDYEVTIRTDDVRYGYILHRSLHYTLEPRKSQRGSITRVGTIEATIEVFRTALNKWFEELTITEWEKTKTVFKSTMDSSNCAALQILLRNWREIQMGAYAFNRLARDIKLINELPIEDLRRSMMHLTSNDSSIRKLSVQAISRREYAEGSADASRRTQSPRSLNFLTNLPGEEAKPDDYYITDIASYTRGLTTYPLLEDHGTS